MAVRGSYAPGVNATIAGSSGLQKRSARPLLTDSQHHQARGGSQAGGEGGGNSTPGGRGKKTVAKGKWKEQAGEVEGSCQQTSREPALMQPP